MMSLNTRAARRAPLVRLLALAVPLRWWVVLSVLLGTAAIGSSVGLMTTSAYIIASAALQPPLADLQVAIVGVRFFGIARGVFRYLERLVSHNVTFGLLARLRVWFYRAAEPLAPAHLQQHRSGDLLSRFVADIETLENFYVRVIAPPLVAALISLGTALFVAHVDPHLAVILLCFLALAGIGLPTLTQVLSRTPGRQIVVVRAALNAELVDGIQGLADLVAFGQAGRHRERVQALTRELSHVQMRLARVESLHSALSALLASLAVLAVLTRAIPLVSQGDLSGVQMAVLVLAVLASFEAVLPLPLAAQNLESCLEAGRRLFAVADTSPPVRNPVVPLPLPEDRSLTVRSLRFCYEPGTPPALDDISFTLAPSSKLAIVGPSGAGKSTLINLLLRFWEYDQGEILLGGCDLRRIDPDDVRRAFSVVTQHTHLFNATIRDNLLVARPDADEAALVRAATLAQLHSFVESLPLGYDTWIGEEGVRLSGGERQRLALARAVLKDAPIFLLDEPTANLDTLTEHAVLQAILAAADDRAVLLTTHRLVGLEAMDEILVLHRGRVAERGSHADLIRQPGGLYRRMWELQNQVLAFEDFERVG